MNEEPNYFQDTKSKIKQYINQRILLVRLQATEKASRIAAIMITIVVITVIALLLVIFTSITAAYWLADIMGGNLAAGFGIVTLFYLVVFLFVIFFLRKILQNFFINKLIQLIYKKD